MHNTRRGSVYYLTVGIKNKIVYVNTFDLEFEATMHKTDLYSARMYSVKNYLEN